MVCWGFQSKRAMVPWPNSCSSIRLSGGGDTSTGQLVGLAAQGRLSLSQTPVRGVPQSGRHEDARLPCGQIYQQKEQCGLLSLQAVTRTYKEHDCRLILALAFCLQSWARHEVKRLARRASQVLGPGLASWGKRKHSCAISLNGFPRQHGRLIKSMVKKKT